MTSGTGSWSTQQLTEFVTAISAAPDAAAAVEIAVQRAAEALEAEVGALVGPDGVEAAIGFPAGSVDDGALAAIARNERTTVEVPGVGTCNAVVAQVDNAGTLVLARLDPAFTVEEANLIRGMARVLGSGLGTIQALANERALLASLGEQQRLLEQLARVQRSIGSRVRLDDVLKTIVEGAAALLGTELATLKLIDVNDPDSMVTLAHTGQDAGLGRTMLRAPVGEGLSGRAIVEGRMIVTDDARNWPAPSRLAPADGTGAMAAPVHEHGSVVGSILVATREPGRRFTEAEQELFRIFSEHSSLALAAARTADQMRQAFNDSLTGLANRALFSDRLEHALAIAERGGTPVTILFLDLDGFKLVNDSLGHLAGDQLLVQVAERIASCLRRSDTAARLGGDEFAVLVQDATTIEQAERAAQRVIDSLRTPFTLGGREVFISASIGIARGGEDADTLLRDADVAMYRAKALGKSRYQMFEPSMHAEVVRRLELEGDLRRALDRDELQLHYQPIYELGTQRVTAVEALLRWQHPERGFIPPLDFIPLAEETGLIHRIGRWVLHTACWQVAEWDRTRAADGSEPLHLSVNLSGEQLVRPELIDDVLEALSGTIDASRLILEITESVLMHDTEATIERLSALKALGVRLAIDDFGTGYSSLRYLSRFPVNILKIAKPFVDGIHTNEGDQTALARMIVHLGSSLELETVAEGIELPEQQARLHEIGCGLGQGFLFARPLDADACAALLQASASAAAA